jgi:ABC-type sugar transport system permease subunit
MAISAQTPPVKRSFLDNYISPTLGTYLTMAWLGFIAIGSIFSAIYLFGLDEFYNLGRPVQYFVGLLSLLPAGASVYAIYHLSQRNSQGRLMAMGINYVGMVLSFAFLLHVWGFYTGMDAMAGAMHENRVWLWGFALAYAIYWLAGRFADETAPQIWLDRLGLGIGMIALVGLLWFGDILGALSHVIDTYGTTRAWMVTLTMLIFAFVAYRMVTLSRYFGESPEQRIAWQGWLFLSPNIIGFLLFFAGPLLFSLYLSFNSSRPQQEPAYVGFEHYIDLFDLELQPQGDLSQAPQRAMSPGYTVINTFRFGDSRYVLGARDDGFWFGMKNTIMFALFLVPLSTIPALFIAIILNSKLAGVKFFRSLYFLPSVAAVVGVGVIWREAMYSSVVGYINFVVTEIVNTLNSAGFNISDPRVVWLQDAKLYAMVIMAAWQIVGFNTVLYLAGLQGIPRVLYEAAEVDGATAWGKFRHVTVPLLGPTTFFVVVTTMINGLQVFNEPYVLFRDTPGNDGLTAVFYIHRATFTGAEKGIDFGYASAVAWCLFILIFLITLIQFRVQRSNPYGN